MSQSKNLRSKRKAFIPNEISVALKTPKARQYLFSGESVSSCPKESENEDGTAHLVKSKRKKVRKTQNFSAFVDGTENELTSRISNNVKRRKLRSSSNSGIEGFCESDEKPKAKKSKKKKFKLPLVNLESRDNDDEDTEGKISGPEGLHELEKKSKSRKPRDKKQKFSRKQKYSSIDSIDSISEVEGNVISEELLELEEKTKNKKVKLPVMNPDDLENMGHEIEAFKKKSSRKKKYSSIDSINSISDVDRDVSFERLREENPKLKKKKVKSTVVNPDDLENIDNETYSTEGKISRKNKYSSIDSISSTSEVKAENYSEKKRKKKKGHKKTIQQEEKIEHKTRSSRKSQKNIFETNMEIHMDNKENIQIANEPIDEIAGISKTSSRFSNSLFIDQTKKKLSAENKRMSRKSDSVQNSEFTDQIGESKEKSVENLNSSGFYMDKTEESEENINKLSDSRMSRKSEESGGIVLKNFDISRKSSRLSNQTKKSIENIEGLRVKNPLNSKERSLNLISESTDQTDEPDKNVANSSVCKRSRFFFSESSGESRENIEKWNVKNSGSSRKNSRNSNTRKSEENIVISTGGNSRTHRNNSRSFNLECTDQTGGSDENIEKPILNSETGESDEIIENNDIDEDTVCDNKYFKSIDEYDCEKSGRNEDEIRNSTNIMSGSFCGSGNISSKQGGRKRWTIVPKVYEEAKNKNKNTSLSANLSNRRSVRKRWSTELKEKFMKSIDFPIREIKEPSNANEIPKEEFKLIDPSGDQSITSTHNKSRKSTDSTRKVNTSHVDSPFPYNIRAKDDTIGKIQGGASNCHSDTEDYHNNTHEISLRRCSKSTHKKSRKSTDSTGKVNTSHVDSPFPYNIRSKDDTIGKIQDEAPNCHSDTEDYHNNTHEISPRRCSKRFSRSLDLLEGISPLEQTLTFENAEATVHEDYSRNTFNRKAQTPGPILRRRGTYDLDVSVTDVSVLRSLSESKLSDTGLLDNQDVSQGVKKSVRFQHVTVRRTCAKKTNPPNSTENKLEAYKSPATNAKKVPPKLAAAKKSVSVDHSIFSASSCATSTPLHTSRKKTLLKQTLKKDLSAVSNKRRSRSVEEKGDKFVSRIRMPNFATIHQKRMDRMEDVLQMTERKAERARLLLSGKKPTSQSSSMTNDNTQKKNNDGAKKPKQLNFIKNTTEVSSNAIVKNKKEERKLKSQHESKNLPILGNKKTIPNMRLDTANSKGLPGKSCIPKRPPIVKIKTSQTDDVLKRTEQMKSIATKSKPQHDTREERRTILKGVRGNRRFELLMKMRNK